MALDIKRSPELSGESAERFLKRIENPVISGMSKKRILAAMAMAKIMKESDRSGK
ncbi:MAG: hypothetical protein H6581_20965 [Bacteroidia bacterium]|nr:hypothetical protein [Bacteroidia bacterium]